METCRSEKGRSGFTARTDYKAFDTPFYPPGWTVFLWSGAMGGLWPADFLVGRSVNPLLPGHQFTEVVRLEPQQGEPYDTPIP